MKRETGKRETEKEGLGDWGTGGRRNGDIKGHKCLNLICVICCKDVEFLRLFVVIGVIFAIQGWKRDNFWQMPQSPFKRHVPKGKRLSNPIINFWLTATGRRLFKKIRQLSNL